MFKFLKNIMNNDEANLTNDAYTLHRILKTEINKNPSVEEDEIIFLALNNPGSKFSLPKLFI